MLGLKSGGDAGLGYLFDSQMDTKLSPECHQKHEYPAIFQLPKAVILVAGNKRAANNKNLQGDLGELEKPWILFKAPTPLGI